MYQNAILAEIPKKKIFFKMRKFFHSAQHDFFVLNRVKLAVENYTYTKLCPTSKIHPINHHISVT